MLFHAVMKLVEFKILVNWGMVHCSANARSTRSPLSEAKFNFTRLSF